MQNYSQQPEKQPLEKNQKIALAVLVFFGLFIISIWAMQFKKSLTEPFVYKGSDNGTEEVENQELNPNDEALKTKDTDIDGLTDWDELNIYKTSPYLEDSDSDSSKDGDEINKGTDPNCPSGQDCTAPVQSGASTSTDSLINTNSTSTISTPNLNASGQSEEELKKMLEGGMNATSLRQLLINSGMDKQVLGKISDNDLMNNYQELIKNSSNLK